MAVMPSPYPVARRVGRRGLTQRKLSPGIPGRFTFVFTTFDTRRGQGSPKPELTRLRSRTSSVTRAYRLRRSTFTPLTKGNAARCPPWSDTRKILVKIGQKRKRAGRLTRSKSLIGLVAASGLEPET